MNNGGIDMLKSIKKNQSHPTAFTIDPAKPDMVPLITAARLLNIAKWDTANCLLQSTLMKPPRAHEAIAPDIFSSIILTYNAQSAPSW